MTVVSYIFGRKFDVSRILYQALYRRYILQVKKPMAPGYRNPQCENISILQFLWLSETLMHGTGILT